MKMMPGSWIPTGGTMTLLIVGQTQLTGMQMNSIIVCMRTTLNIEDALLRKAARLTGTSKKTALVRMGLEALIARESAKRLADLGGTERGVTLVRRRRPRPVA